MWIVSTNNPVHECKAYAEKLKEIPIHMFIVWVLWLIHTKMGNTITYGEWKKPFRIPKPMQKCETGAAAGRNARNNWIATKKDIEKSFNVLHHYFTVVGFYLSVLFYYQKTWVNPCKWWGWHDVPRTRGNEGQPCDDPDLPRTVYHWVFPAWLAGKSVVFMSSHHPNILHPINGPNYHLVI